MICRIQAKVEGQKQEEWSKVATDHQIRRTCKNPTKYFTQRDSKKDRKWSKVLVEIFSADMQGQSRKQEKCSKVATNHQIKRTCKSPTKYFTQEVRKQERQEMEQIASQNIFC